MNYTPEYIKGMNMSIFYGCLHGIIFTIELFDKNNKKNSIKIFLNTTIKHTVYNIMLWSFIRILKRSIKSFV